MINVFEPSVGQEELAAVEAVFQSNWLGRGNAAARFEADFAHHLGVEKGQLLSITSCTDGLFLAMDLLGVDDRSFVVMPSIHFVGAANAVFARGGSVRLCDVNSRTLNPTVDHIRAALNRPGVCKAIVLLHYGGVPCDMDDILQLAAERHIAVVEDSACSPASLYKGKAVGTLGHIGLWSFDAMKAMSTGDGGMMYFDRHEARQLASMYGYLGQNKRSGLESSGEEWWHFGVVHPGRRMLMNDVTAAIGIEQLKKLPGFVSRRLEIARMYSDTLRDTGLVLPPTDDGYYFYWVQFPDRATRNRAASYLRDNGVYTTFRYYPLHKMILYNKSRVSAWPGADRAEETTLLLPLHQSLSDDDVAKVCDLLLELA